MTEDEKKRKTQEYNKAYREKNREKLKANDKAYHAANREARNIARKEWGKKNPDAMREWQRANPEKVKNNLLKHKYGITLEQYNQMLADQNMSCKICLTTEPRGQGNFHVDHCHKTGKIRGLLCHNCNTGLGGFQDDPEVIKRAIEYLMVQY